MTPEVPAPVRRSASRPRWLPDLIGAAAFAIFAAVITHHLRPQSGGRELDAFGYAVIIAMGAALGFCRRYPRWSSAAVIVLLGCYVGRQYSDGPVYLAGLIALILLSWRTTRRTGLAAAIGLAAALAVADLFVGRAFSPVPLFVLGWSVAIVFVGEALRSRRSYLAQLEERARFLEHSREEEARRRVAEERLLIARDLHDSVAHAMATINVQAGAAAHVVDRRPEAAKQALSAIQRASGDVLDELGAMLSLLREDGTRPDRAPTPGIEQVRQLIASTDDPRLHITLDIGGPTAQVSKPIGTTVYRIVQESLTNVMRHSGATRVRVRVQAGGDGDLLVEVHDNGSGAAEPNAGTGNGLRGMRERAESTGGQFAAGPDPAGGFAVRASWSARP